MSAPPRRALHGPWEEVTHGELGQEQRNGIVAKIKDGKCNCACCRYHGKPAGLPTRQMNGDVKDNWIWCRQPTGEQKRKNPELARMPKTWPLWIYEQVGGP